MKQTILGHPRFDSLVDTVVTNNPKRFEKGSAEFLRFPDNTPNLRFPNVKKDIEHRDVTYIGDFSQADELFEHYNTLFNLVKNTADKVRIILPYFPMGTSERVERKGETETAHAFAHLISSLPSGRDAKNSVHIFDIHALVEQSLFNPDRINAELHTTTGLLKLKKGEVIAFPDDGAAKRFKDIFPDVPRIICGKIRDGEKRIVTLKEGDPKGKKVIIIDDLIQTGATLIETAHMLRAMGATSVRAFAPHGVFPSDSHIRLASELDEIVVTDTIPANIDRAKALVNMRVISIAPLIEKILRRK
ncbi:MAG: ribose-phosphate diphosphokinase [Candidatus Gracilibacteria bacterium]|nr:ribose-phosphate diphosphokinase [Candidatus Gracilibacteria bacterium]